MKYLGLCLVLVCSVACGRNDEPQDVVNDDPQKVADQVSAEVQETIDRALKGEQPEVDSEAVEGCSIFDSGLIPEVFGVDASIVNYQSSIPSRRAGHVVCSAFWDKPNKEELDKAYTDAIMEWTRTMRDDDRKPRPDYPKTSSQVSLTLVANTFDSSAEAVASLEGTVETMSKGVTFEVGGKQHESKMSFGDWIDGVGDKAIFSDKGGLLFAYDARRYSIGVSVMGDAEQDREKAIELAQRIIDSKGL